MIWKADKARPLCGTCQNPVAHRPRAVTMGVIRALKLPVHGRAAALSVRLVFVPCEVAFVLSRSVTPVLPSVHFLACDLARLVCTALNKLFLFYKWSMFRLSRAAAWTRVAIADHHYGPSGFPKRRPQLFLCEFLSQITSRASKIT